MAEGDDLIRHWCRSGDDAAFDRFYTAQAPALWRFVVLRGVDREEAYDLVADAFARFIGSACRRPDAPRALLYRIALNLVTDWFRRRRVRPVSGIEPDGLRHGQPPAELAEEARRLLASLDPGEQNLLLMRYWLGMTHREIAAALEIPEGTARRQAAALLNRMQEGTDDA